MKLSSPLAALCASGLLALCAGSAVSGRVGPDPARPPTGLDNLLWPEAARSAPAWTDQAGETLTADALRDKVVVVSFFKTTCLITCVVQTMNLDAAARALPATARADVAFLSVTVDPAQDDVATLKRFAENLKLAPGPLRLIRTTPGAVAAMNVALRYPTAQADTPPGMVLVFDRRGQIAMSYAGDPLDGPRVLRDVVQLTQFPDGVGRPARTEPAASAPAAPL